MKIVVRFFVFVCVCFTHTIYCQELELNHIKTIQVRDLANGNQTNLIPLGKTLEFSFDDLEANQKSYYYKVEHMTHDWKKSKLLLSQYIDGFQKNIILDIENSFNTFQVYSHYNFTIPNKNTVVTKSGNYLISVLDEYDDIVFTRKVTFYESIANVGVSVSRSRNTSFSNQQQTVQFIVNHPTIKMNFPQKEVHVVIMQNQNWKTTITGIEPQFFKVNQLIYKYTNTTNFFGGNEYLNFDTKLIQNQSVNVRKIVRKEVFYNFLYPYDSKIVKNYTFSPDINGQFLIQTAEGSNNKTEADYAMMHFYLKPLDKEKNLEVYVYGGFNNFALNESNKMIYNNTNQSFEANILLKQGFYNYTYVTKENGSINLGGILGNFSKTENRYDVIVYFKPIGGLYDRVIGLGSIKFEGEF